MALPLVTLNEIKTKGFHAPLTWEICTGEIWTITGRNGTGKSSLAAIIAGQEIPLFGTIKYHFEGKNHLLHKNEKNNIIRDIRIISFNAAYTIADYNELYYQQRYNSTDLEKVPRVSDLFDGVNPSEDASYRLIKTLNIHRLMDRFLIQLSSGELRKVIIAKILSGNPRMVIFDNPFIGLDFSSRIYLEEIFTQLIKSGIQLMFLISSGNEIPRCTTHILELQKQDKPKVYTTDKIRTGYDESLNPIPDFEISNTVFLKTARPEFQKVLHMKDISIKYNDKIICEGFNWEIQCGEKWALSGPNGSGKSTILSYIYADNPRSYISGFSLFDRPRGSGESIWEIKKHVGFTSSEMHMYYRKKTTCLQVIESGIFDSVGLYRSCYGEEKNYAWNMLKTLHIEELADRLFLDISSGEQRLVLFGRALIKNPDVLILDEPFHGLDNYNKKLCKAFIDAYSAQKYKTLIFITHNQQDIPSCVTLFKEIC